MMQIVEFDGIMVVEEGKKGKNVGEMVERVIRSGKKGVFKLMLGMWIGDEVWIQMEVWGI